MRARGVLVLVGVGLVTLVAVASAAPSTLIVGGSAPQRALLQRILAGLGSTHIRELRIAVVAGGVKLQTAATGIRPTWEALVVGGAFLDRSRALGLPTLAEVDADHAAWPTSNASTVPPRATRWTALGMRRSLLRLARASGAEVAELSVSRPDALAVALRLYVTNAAAFLRHRLRALVLHARQHESRYEGVYIEVDDARGQAWANAEARLGGLSYVRPNLRGCDPFPPPSPGPPGQPLPPCPT